MSREHNTDLTRLAILAQTRAGDLKPLLLRVHAMAFAAEDHHDVGSTTTFASLAEGLIPFVPPEVAADVKALLEGVADVPPGVLDLLMQQSAGLGEPDPLSARRIAVLVDNARRRPSLARDLLARSELSPFDRAALYRHADESLRDEIRTDLALCLAVSPSTVRVLDARDRALLLVVAQAAGFRATLAQAARFLGLDPVPDWRPHRPLDAELFALALVALGLDREECVRVFLTTDDAISRSVRTVFRLSEVARTPAIVAAHLVRADLGLADEAVRQGVTDETATRRHDTVASRPAALPAASVTRAREADRGAYGRHGYRSRSTISRDRS